MRKICLSVFIFLSAVTTGYCQQSQEQLIMALSSPVQEQRDAAAGQLKSNFHPSDKAHWEKLLLDFHPRMLRRDFENKISYLISGKAMAEGSIGQGMGAESTNYRLDNSYTLTVWYDTQGRLGSFKINEQMANVWVAPPADFSGKWDVYYVNGVKSNEINYVNGVYDGDVVSYDSLGHVVVWQKYKQGKIDGEERDFYPSGQLRFKGEFQDGQAVGESIWYNEDGSVNNSQTK